VIEEVLRGYPSPRYRIRWDDGHEIIYTRARVARFEPNGAASARAKRCHGNANPFPQ
jgi:hypothetical protein